MSKLAVMWTQASPRPAPAMEDAHAQHRARELALVVSVWLRSYDVNPTQPVRGRVQNKNSKYIFFLYLGVCVWGSVLLVH